MSDDPRPRGVVLRPYQARARSCVFDEFGGGVRSTLVVMATGTGKTYLFGSVAKMVIDQGGKVLILAHRQELLSQAANSLAEFDIDAAIEKAERNARTSLLGEPDCVVASVQTLRGDRLASWPRKHFKLIVVDECHHVTANSYKNIIEHFDPDWHLGVTATADRLDGENLGQAYETLAFEYSLREAINNRDLCRLEIVRCDTTVDLSAIRTTGGDLNDEDLAEALRPHVEELANSIKQEVGKRPLIGFTPDVRSAEAFATAMTSIGIPSESISHDSPNRDEITEAFRRGHTKAIFNCQIYTEGVDLPFVSAIAMLRPTKSRALFSQMIGRGVRNYAGKQNCIIIDFAWRQMTGKHQLVSPVELFDTTRMDKEVQDLALALVNSGESPDLMDAIERAEVEHQEKVKLRIKVREREARYRRVSYDPFATMETLGIPMRRESEASLAVRPSDKQVQFLQKLGVADAASMSKKRASMMIGILKERMDKGLATAKQVAHLVNNGIDPDEARALSKKDASDLLDQFFSRRRA